MYIVQDTSQSLALYLSTLNIAAVLVDPSSPPQGEGEHSCPKQLQALEAAQVDELQEMAGEEGREWDRAMHHVLGDQDGTEEAAGLVEHLRALQDRCMVAVH